MDKSFLPSGSGIVELKESNTVASSSSGSHAVVLVNRAITSGKVGASIHVQDFVSCVISCSLCPVAYSPRVTGELGDSS